jgi:gas vesicle protein
MNRSKQYALLFLLGALLAGGVMGFTAALTFASDRPTPNGQDFRRRFAEDLDLSESQRAAVDEILDERNRQLQTVLAPVRPQMDSIKNHARQQIRQLLDERQRARFEAYLAEQERERAQNKASTQGARQ